MIETKKIFNAFFTDPTEEHIEVQSFIDEEVNQDYVKVLLTFPSDGEIVTIDGSHLGHVEPPNTLGEGYGNRYCVNLMGIAGYEVK